jgi:hypothetical protein
MQKTIDWQIMMCDNAEELLALASLMLTNAKNIYVQQITRKGAIELMETVVRDMKYE